MIRALGLSALLLAISARGQTASLLTPQRVADEAPPSATSFASRSEPHTGWARAGGGLGFGLAAVPLGLVIASVVASYKIGLTTQEGLLVAAGLSAPLVALLPTFSGRSALVDDDHAHKPRILRILGWVCTGFATFGLVSSPIVGRLLMLVRLSDGSPSIFGSVFNILDGMLASFGVVLISVASIVSARAAEGSTVPQQPEHWASSVRWAPLVAFLPSKEGGNVVAGVAASF